MRWHFSQLRLRYWIALAVVFFSASQLTSTSVALVLGLASMPLVWLVSRRWGDTEAQAETFQSPHGAAATGSQFRRIVSRIF